MAQENIYVVDQAGGLTAMTPSAPRDEDTMQALVAKYPELITDDDGDLLLVRREQPIDDSPDGGGKMSLDHLFVTKSGVPVLVELKRATDTRIRREVVGQMLDYAANAVAYWRPGQLALSFAATAEASGKDADSLLAEFLGEVDPGEFWQTVESNFAAGRVKLVFVADTIPSKLARIIEFLNDQMTADVRGIELRWFESQDRGLLTLSPRVIGETERAQATKAASRGALPPIEPEQWIEEKIAPHGSSAKAAALNFLALVEETGGEPGVPSTQGSVYGIYRNGARNLYPLFLVKTGGGQVQLALGYLVSWDAFKPEERRQSLVNRLTSIVGPLTKRPLNGFPAFPVTMLNDPDKREAVAEFVREIVDESSVPG